MYAAVFCVSCFTSVHVGMCWTELFVCCLVVLLALALYDVTRPSNYPPGPRWLPLVGNLPQVIALRRYFGFTHLVWAQFVTSYGPLVGLRLGQDLIVIVSGSQLVRQVSNSEVFDGRPDGFFFRLRAFGERLVDGTASLHVIAGVVCCITHAVAFNTFGGTFGIVHSIAFVDGPFYHEQKRFIIRQLKEFGFGGRSMEQLVLEDTTQLIEWLKSQMVREEDSEENIASLMIKIINKDGSGAITIHEMFNVSVLNSLWKMCTGSRLSLSDVRLRKLLSLLRESFRLQDMSGGLLNQMPFLRFIAPQLSGYNKIVHVIQSLNDFLEETINIHKNTLQPNIIRDLTDAFLHEVKNRENNQDTSFTEKQLLVLLLDLFMAGSETTSNTLAFAVMFLLQHPNVQKRAHEELDLNLEPGKSPTLKDRPRLTYIEAIILESQRLGNVAPITPPHRAKRETVLHGFNIPKDTTVLLSIHSVHMDGKYWKDPEVFRPERFLDADKKIIQYDNFIPFGLGRRRCLGEVLAKTSLFLIFASLLHHFDFALEQGTELPTTFAIDGATLSPPHFKCVLTPRLS